MRAFKIGGPKEKILEFFDKTTIDSDNTLCKVKCRAL